MEPHHGAEAEAGIQAKDFFESTPGTMSAMSAMSVNPVMARVRGRRH